MTSLYIVQISLISCNIRANLVQINSTKKKKKKENVRFATLCLHPFA